MKKNYVIDTNVLIEDEKSIEILKNGNENKIFIPYTVIEELDKLKDKKPQLKNRIFQIIEEFENYKNYIKIIKSDRANTKDNDNNILFEILDNNIKDPILVTNDKILRFKAFINKISTEEYQRSIPFQQESEEYTGFVESENDLIQNCFYWDDGKPTFWNKNGAKKITYEHNIWKVKPWDIYQNCLMELILNKDINLVSVQSGPGKGKTYIALACAFYLVFEKKLFDKVYVVKSNYEIGKEIGWLPGDVNDKILPYFRPIQELTNKITKNRNLPTKAYENPEKTGFNKNFVEFMPINFLRGMNLENCVIIADEFQNLSKSEARSFLSRMGENVKCICTGDIHQIDNPYLSQNNNALNWIVKLFKDDIKYAHVVLKGKNTRGPICKLVIERGL